MKTVQLTIDGSTNRQVKNPKTTAQTLQRILIKVVGISYAKLRSDKKTDSTILKPPKFY